VAENRRVIHRFDAYN